MGRVFGTVRSTRRRRHTLTFEVIPAIDLRGGRCVRLFNGDYDRETEYSADPVAVARQWESLGASRLHVVDLDGARAGRPENGEVMRQICSALSIPVEVSGGLRTIESLDEAAEYGAARLQVGSIAAREPERVKDFVARHGDKIVVSIDARGGEVMTDGWEKGSGVGAVALARKMAGYGVARVMVTDISRDGALQGPNVEGMRRFVEELPIPVVASGGVTALSNLTDLANAGCEGVIVGTALYEGRFALPEALEAVAAC
jgi:phosphoribosylformimino-5-aminoimidazole carboxamide ribotide isomerase